MAEESTAQKVDTGLVAAIVRSYVAKNSVAVDQVASLITTVHRALSGLGTNTLARVAEALTPAVPIRRSVQQDHVVCLECGFRGQTLRRHLGVRHGSQMSILGITRQKPWGASEGNPIQPSRSADRA
jgi:predicted transcriptional regulator